MLTVNETKIRGFILVVDDDEEDHEILKSACEVIGVLDSLKFFYDGMSLLRYLQTDSAQPFLILCDINMPNINGLDLREIIWNDEVLRRKSIPFVFFSTGVSKSQVTRAFDLTVQGFFSKGNTMEETVKKIKLMIDYWNESKHPNSIDYASFKRPVVLPPLA